MAQISAHADETELIQDTCKTSGKEMPDVSLQKLMSLSS